MADANLNTCPKCDGKGLIRGEPRGHDADGEPLFVWSYCDCKASWLDRQYHQMRQDRLHGEQARKPQEGN
jgi:hypothetical protein